MFRRLSLLFLIALVRILAGPGLCLAATDGDAGGRGRPAPCYIDVCAFADAFAVLDSEGNVLRVETSDTAAPQIADTIAVIRLSPLPSGSLIFMSAWEDGLLVLCGTNIQLISPDGSVSAFSLEGDAPAEFSVFNEAASRVKGRIIDFAAGPQPSGEGMLLYAVSDSAEFVCVRPDGEVSVMDINKEYEDYYGRLQLHDIALSPDMICISATDGSDSPKVLLSTRGQVWILRDTDYTLFGERCSLQEKPLDLAYSSRDDEFVIMCSGGILFHLPSCSHCNYPEFSQEPGLRRLASSKRGSLAVGNVLY